MKDVRKKYEKWYGEIKEGKGNYAMLIKQKGEWSYCSNGSVERISSISIVMFKKENVDVFYDWNKEVSKENNRDFVIIIKDDKKLLINDEKEGIFSFGISNTEEDVEKVLILFTVDDVNTMISGGKKYKNVDVCYNISSIEENPLQECLCEIIHALVNKNTKNNEVE